MPSSFVHDDAPAADESVDHAVGEGQREEADIKSKRGWLLGMVFIVLVRAQITCRGNTDSCRRQSSGTTTYAAAAAGAGGCYSSAKGGERTVGCRLINAIPRCEFILSDLWSWYLSVEFYTP